MGAVLACIASVSLPDRATAQTVEPPATFSADLQAIATKHNLGRFWLHVEKGGEVIANLGIRGAGPDAPEPVGSLSKSITGIAIALLIQEGKLTLDASVADVLAKLYAQHKRPIDPSMKAVTIARLLTHTAGLRPNKITDPVNGIASDAVLRTLGANPTAFDFLNATNGDHSNGESKFVYSNLSFLMLGLVVEAVSGESYESFCQKHIFQPLQIIDASLIGGRYRAISSYSGWILTRRDIVTVWRRVFSLEKPDLLTRETLDKTLLAPLGELSGAHNDVRYVMGVYVRPNADRSIYRLFHNGAQGTGLLGPAYATSYYSYLEDTVPGSVWIFATSPTPPEKEWSLISADVRKLLQDSVLK